MAKKIFALVAAVVLVVCFSVTSFAATVIPTTTYVDGKISVEVKVTGVNNGDNVTYYATNGDTKVFVDQKKADANGATFNFVTDLANVGSTVKVGYTNGTAVGGEIEDAAKYTITYGELSLGSVYPGESVTVEIDNPAGEFETVKAVKANGEVVAYNPNGTKLSVTLSNVTANVVITVETEEKTIDGYQGELSIVDAGAVEVKASSKPEYQGGIKIDGLLDNEGNKVTDESAIAGANANKVGDRKLTVCGKASGFDKFGIIVSTTAIEAENFRPTDFETTFAGKTYEAKTCAADGKFAVQLIDVSDKGAAESFVVSGTPYYTAVYGYSVANQAYYVLPLANAVTAN